MKDKKKNKIIIKSVLGAVLTVAIFISMYFGINYVRDKNAELTAPNNTETLEYIEYTRDKSEKSRTTTDTKGNDTSAAKNQSKEQTTLFTPTEYVAPTMPEDRPLNAEEKQWVIENFLEEFKKYGVPDTYYYKEVGADYKFNGNGTRLTQNNYKKQVGNKHLIELLAKDTVSVFYRFDDEGNRTIFHYECHSKGYKEFNQENEAN